MNEEKYVLNLPITRNALAKRMIAKSDIEPYLGKNLYGMQWNVIIQALYLGVEKDFLRRLADDKYPWQWLSFFLDGHLKGHDLFHLWDDNLSYDLEHLITNRHLAMTNGWI